MPLRKIQCHVIAVLLLFCGLLLSVSPAQAQAEGQSSSQGAAPQRPLETNLEIQLYMLIGTNSQGEGAKLPAALDGVVKQLRGSLPYSNYRLAATMLNRIRSGGRLRVTWVGASVLNSQAANTSSTTPAFNQLDVAPIKLIQDAAGQEMVQMLNFNFGARIPVQTGTSVAANSTSGFPVINYEPTGISTDINLNLGEPTLVGTLNMGMTNEAIILVVSAKKVSTR